MKLDDLKARLDAFLERPEIVSLVAVKDGDMVNITTRTIDPFAKITDLEALVGELGETLKPFADIRTQMPESIKLIQKNVDGMKPITITVTKAQMQTAVATLAKLEKARG